jgi:Soluble lytic murein transglycosylase and related regulatory proteins (some contain LysM/invasin domains)
MSDNLNRVNSNRSSEPEIPAFMMSPEYELRRQRRFQEEREKNRYKLQQNARAMERRAIQKKKKQRQKVIKIVVSGVVILVFSVGLLNHLSVGIKNRTNVEVSSIEIVEVMDVFEPIPTIEIEPNIIIPEEIIYNFDLETRLSSINSDNKFSVGSEIITSEYVRNKILNSDAYDYFIKYGEMYGIDPFILMAKAVQESSLSHNACLPGGANYNGNGVGICQLENPDNRELVAHNYITGEDDVMYVTMDNAKDLEKNIQMGAMNFQRCLERCNGNILLAIQSYNYDPGMINRIINIYAEQIGVSADSVKSNYADTNWLSIVDDVHNNPNKYISNWRYSTYGDNNYISNVLRYFIGDKTYYYYDGTKYVFDLNTYEINEITNENRIRM